MTLVLDAADTFIRDNIALIIGVIDEHDAGILNDELYMCPCRFAGTETQWHTHIADLIVTRLAKQVELQLLTVDEDRYRWGHKHNPIPITTTAQEA